MGLLSLGTPLPWSSVPPHAAHVRAHGIAQFLNIWTRVRARRKDHLLWGDEVEYIVVGLDERSRRARLLLSAAEQSLAALVRIEHDAVAAGAVPDSSWKPEYGRYMLEGTPGEPYGATIDDFLAVEDNMRKRRALANSLLDTDQYVFTFTNFPILGCVGEFLEPHYDPTPHSGASQSLFIPDEAINAHARFPTLTANIRLRRGSKVAINVPIFKDTHTPSPFREHVPPALIESLVRQGVNLIPETIPEYTPDALEDHVYMDCMCFGMGCCCLQVTFQACSVEEARRLYDHLAVMAPIMLALTAAAPIFRGFLTDVDCRWNVIAGSVDDRTREERGLDPLQNARFRMPKSRYDSISRYLSPGPNYSGGCSSNDPDLNRPTVGSEYYRDEYNDLNPPMDMDIYQQLVDGGVDDLLAKHYAHLFIRDPLVLYRELLDQDDQTSSDHFENIQSTNWQTMRFKPPPPSSPNMGWRVEFRSMEVQLTDHENAAFSIFVVLLTRTILAFKLNFYIPLSKVDENMTKAQQRNAVFNEQFWFRTDVLPEILDDPCCCNGSPSQLPPDVINLIRNGHPNGPSSASSASSGSGSSSSMSQDGNNQAGSVEWTHMSINTIMNGGPCTGAPNGKFVGLIALVNAYLDVTEMSDVTRIKLKRYVSVVSQKASGERMTAAAWIRKFVCEHPEYRQDSVVSDSITYDLCRATQDLFADDLVSGRPQVPPFVPVRPAPVQRAGIESMPLH